MPASSKSSSSRKLLIAAVALFVLLGAAMDLWRRHGRTAPSAPVQLTGDSGLTTEPALSPDGRLLAYASDRGGHVLDIWVQPVRGGAPKRLTTGDADSHSPAFSADGTRIAFRSERGEGGVYVAPAAGGEPAPAAARGRDPRFSPDGKWLAWWVRRDEGEGEIYIAPSAGGEPRRFCPECKSARYPVWSPDSRHVLFLGNDGQTTDWYTAPAAGGKPSRTGANAILQFQAFWGDAAPSAWSGDNIFFTALADRTANIWRMPISPGVLQCAAGATKLTFGTGREAHATVVNGSMAYASTVFQPAVWMLPLDGKGGAAGEPSRITAGEPGMRMQPSVSADGRRVAFRRKEDIWVKEIDGGKETRVRAGEAGDSPVLISPDGTRVLYRADGGLMAAPVAGGEPERVCEHCWQPWSWSADGSSVLFQEGRSVAVVYASSRERRTVIRSREEPLYEPRFSPDGKWIALHTAGRGRSFGTRQVWIVPFREGPSAKQSEWIAVTEKGGTGRHPCWSADGTVLYYLCERDGFRCIWGQRLDRTTRQPRGEPFAVRHFHNTRHGLTDPRNTTEMSLAAARDKLVFTVFETTGNVWLARVAR